MDSRDLRDAHRLFDYADLFRETLSSPDHGLFYPLQPSRVFRCEDRGSLDPCGFGHQYPVTDAHIG